MPLFPTKQDQLVTGKQVTDQSEGIPQKLIFPSEMVGSFGNLISAQEYSVLHINFPYQLNSDLVNASGTLGGYVTSSNGMAQLYTGTGSTGEASLESISALKYISGQGAKIKFAGYFSSPIASSTQEIGIGDDTDGFFFGYSGSQFGVCRRNNGVDNWSLQTNWSGDKMDGTGPSNMTLYPVSGNVYMIQYQWLGFGAIKFLVGESNTGKFYPVHTIAYSNANSVPSIANPTLPLRIACRNWGNTTNLNINVSSMGAFTEGYPSHVGPRYSFNNGKTVSTEAALFTIKNNITHFGKKNRTRVFVDYLSISNRSNNDTVNVRVVLNTTLGGSPSYSQINSNSVMLTDTAGTTLTSGRNLFNFELAPDSSLGIDLVDHDFRINPGETITVAASASASTTVFAGFSWEEEF